MLLCCTALICNQFGLSGPAVQQEFRDRLQWFVHLIISPPQTSDLFHWDETNHIELASNYTL